MTVGDGSLKPCATIVLLYVVDPDRPGSVLGFVLDLTPTPPSFALLVCENKPQHMAEHISFILCEAPVTHRPPDTFVLDL